MSTETNPQSTTRIRPAFTARMQAELDAPENATKNLQAGGWAGWQPDSFAIMHEMRMHILKLDLALQKGDPDAVSHYAADMANYAMKVSEIHGNA